MDNDALQSGLRKLIGYASGSYHPGYIHMTQDEAKALLQGLEKLATSAVTS